MEVKRLSSLSREYVSYAVSASEGGSAIDPTTLNVEMAFTVGEPVTGDWKDADWETSSGVYLARCLVGPGGTITLSDGSYSVWIRITDSPEMPVMHVGYLVIE